MCSVKQKILGRLRLAFETKFDFVNVCSKKVSLNIIGKKRIMTKRPIKISVRLYRQKPPASMHWHRNAAVKKNPLIRRLIMSVEIKPRPTEGQLRLVREISGIANNINQITRLANTVKSVSPAQVEELQRLCSEALSLVRESL